MDDSHIPAISILVCTRNRFNVFRACVESILKNRFTDYELVVIDQSDGNESARFISSLVDDRIVFISTDTRGLSRARNLAILKSRAPIITFTDDDCVCDEKWIGEIVREFKENPDISGLYGRVKPWGDRVSEGLFCHCLIDDDDERTIDKPAPPHRYLGHGNNMAFRRDFFKKVGLYNPLMGAGSRMKSGEDTDMTFRGLRQYLPLKYSPAPLVYHNNWNTHAQADKMNLGYVLGFVMVFGKFSLHGDRTAMRCLRERLGELVKVELFGSYKTRNWPKFRRTCLMIVYYFLGFFPAVFFRLKGDLPFPDTNEE